MSTKKACLDYDPAIIYHSHSSNIPHLNSWIDDLVHLTENSLPVQTNPTTENLVQALQRYDAVFREILRQTAIFSEPITRMLAKIWAGVLKLLDYMIKSYHRYVKHTTHLQDQAQQLLAERQAQMAASKIRDEEFELERTALRAKIRNLEAELEVMRADKRSMERDNSRLRTVINTYIQSKELNEPVWSLMDESAVQAGLEDDDGLPRDKDLGFKRRDAVDAGFNQLKIFNRIEIEMNEVLANVLKEKDRQRLLVTDLTSLMERNKEVFGPGKWVRGRYITGSTKPIEIADFGCQADEKDQYGVVDDAVEVPRDEQVTAPPIVSSGMRIRGHSYPYALRKLMSSFPRVLRIPSAAWTCQTVLALYFEKNRTDKQLSSQGRPLDGMGDFIYKYFINTLGHPAIAEVQVAQFLAACEHHMISLKRVALLASQLGLYNKMTQPSMDVRDTSFILAVLDHLQLQGELTVDTSRKPGKHNVNYIRPDILRASAVKTVEHLFAKLIPDGGQDYVIKIKSMASSERGTKYIDVDEFIEIALEPWTTVRMTWEDHARFLFSSNCEVFSVLCEAMFANDNGYNDKDAQIVQVHKSSTNDCMRRPLRFFMRQQEAVSDAQAAEDKGLKLASAHVKKATGPAGNPNKDPVVEIMNRKSFGTAISLINPKITVQEIDAYFSDACNWSHRNALRVLEQQWKQCVDDGQSYSETRGESNARNGEAMLRSIRVPTNCVYYANLLVNTTQWTQPYHQRTFYSQDIEVDAFVAVLIHRNVFGTSPLVELLHLSPKDLWPNADMFLKQVQAAALKAQKALELEQNALAAAANAAAQVALEAAKTKAAADAFKAAKLKTNKAAKKKPTRGKGKHKGGSSGNTVSHATDGLGNLSEDGNDTGNESNGEDGGGGGSAGVRGTSGGQSGGMTSKLEMEGISESEAEDAPATGRPTTSHSTKNAED